MATSPAARRRVEHAARMNEAIKLRRQAKTFREIAETLGVAKSTAIELVYAGLEEIRSEVYSNAELLLVQEVDAINELVAAVRPMALGDPGKDIEPSLAAVEQMRKLYDQRDRLLGLYETKVLVRGADEEEAKLRVAEALGVPPDEVVNELARRRAEKRAS